MARSDDPAAAGTTPLVTAKTSAAATFALVFGLGALLCALALFLSPLAIVFGLVAIVLGAVGISRTTDPGLTGRALAITGVVLGALGLLLGVALVAGVTTFLSDEANLDRIEAQLQDLRDELPTDVPGNDG